MIKLKQRSKLIASILAFVMLSLSGPYQSVRAAMIDTESVLKIKAGKNTRDYIITLLSRKDIQTSLIEQGVDPQEAIDRIETLTEAELNWVTDKIGELPSGSGVAETLIIVIFLVFLVLLITDIAGYTDVFTFVKKDVAKKSDRKKTSSATDSQKNVQHAKENNENIKYENLAVYFDRDSNELSKKAFEKLDGVAEILLRDSQVTITLIGYSDSTGTASYREMLSESRVMSVKTYLLGKGVDPPKIKTASQGTKNKSSNDNTNKETQLKKGVEIIFNYRGN